MNALNLDRLNEQSPYSIWLDGEELKFWTDYNVLMVVDFDYYEPIADLVAYWFNLSNRSHRPSPRDPKVRMTVICIIEEFFRVNPNILLYMCDTADDQQAMRSRLFLRWFKGYEFQQEYTIRTAQLVDDGIESYIALIIQRSHPDYEAIISFFDSEIALFQENKP